MVKPTKPWPRPARDKNAYTIDVVETVNYTLLACVTDGGVWVDRNGRCTKCGDELVTSREAWDHLEPAARPTDVFTVRYKAWKQRDGQLIRIKEMADSHLVAAIRMCEERAKDADERHRDNQDGTDPWEYEWGLHRGYDDLVFEAKVRGIAL